MKTYLVGGAVRDKLLGYPFSERDWVVTGALPESLIAQGYTQVGKDFPVFLHPETREEYALARTERKQGFGYYGFACDFNPTIALEEDLLRRDLTINAMAMDDRGTIIDPYDGQRDLKLKVLRHVSNAFTDDPVRVLRVARFAARFHHLGFTLAEETRQLIYQMVKHGELAHLIPERVWQEWRGSLEEKNPEIFITTLRSTGALRVIIPELDILFGIPASAKSHPEIDSGVHTLQVLAAATKISDDSHVRFAACVHDLGKAATPMALWPKHADHDIAGVPIIRQLCQRLRVPSDYRHVAVLAAECHLYIHRLYELNAVTIIEILNKMDVFRRPTLLDKVLRVSRADSRDEDYPQAAEWLHIFEACASVKADAFLKKGLRGDAIKQAIQAERVTCVSMMIIKRLQDET